MTTTESDESRLGRLEGQMDQQSIAIQDLGRRLDTGLAEIRQEMRAVSNWMDQALQDFRQELRAVNARIDRLLLATWAIGGGIIAALVVQIIRAG
jgi:uncharacterized coiled-coil protein SlyX